MLIFPCITALALLAASEAAPADAASAPPPPPPPPATAEQWGVWELSLTGPSDDDVANPFEDVAFNASFTLANTTTVAIAGFYDGSGTYVVRKPLLRPQAEYFIVALGCGLG